QKLPVLRERDLPVTQDRPLLAEAALELVDGEEGRPDDALADRVDDVAVLDTEPDVARTRAAALLGAFGAWTRVVLDALTRADLARLALASALDEAAGLGKLEAQTLRTGSRPDWGEAGIAGEGRRRIAVVAAG